MKEKNKKGGGIASRHILYIVVLICVTLIGVTWIFGNTNPVTNALARFVIPMQSGLNQLGSTMADQLEDLRTLQSAQQENKLLRSEENKQANLELLATAVAQMTDGDFEACVTTLDTIDTVSFSEEDMAKYNSVKTTAYPKAADSYYTKGKSEFLSNNFTEAKTYLETAMNYTSNENFVDDTLYYLAKIAEEDGDTMKAKEYYNKIVKGYPDSNQLTNVKNALQALNENAN